MADALERLGTVDPKVIWQWRLGEWQGTVPEMLDNLTLYFHERRMLYLRLLSVLEPLAIITVGVIQGIVVISSYLPLFHIVDLMGPGGLP